MQHHSLHDTSIAEPRAPRRSYRGLAVLHTPCGQVTCIGGDISETGILLYPQGAQALSLPTTVRVAFVLPEQRRWVALDATVVRASYSNRRAAVALRFENMARRVAFLLRDFVDKGATPAARSRGDITPRHFAMPPEPADASPVEVAIDETTTAVDEMRFEH